MKSLIAFFFPFHLFLLSPLLHAQEMFIACDSLALPGSYVRQTPDGGFLLHTWSTAKHVYSDPGFALIKLDASGKPEWGRLYPAMLGGGRGSFSPYGVFFDGTGTIFVAGRTAIDPDHHYPAVATFTPQGIPMWSRLVRNRQGRSTDIEQFRNENLAVCGILYGESAEVPGMVTAPAPSLAGGPFLAVMTSAGEDVWAKGIESVNEETITGLSLFPMVSGIGLVGNVDAEGCCVDNPMLLLTVGEDGSISGSEVVSVRSKNRATAFFSLNPQECLSTESGTIIYGQLSERIPIPGDNPNIMPRITEKGSSLFVMKLDRNNRILWGKRIGVEESRIGSFIGRVTTGGEIILARTDENNPTMMIRLDSTGSPLSARTFAKGIETRFEDYDEDAPPHPPLEYFSVTALAPTFDGGIAGLCSLDVEATGSEELEEQGYFPYYSAGLFRFDPGFAPQCLHSEPATISVEPLEFVRESYEIRLVEIDTTISSMTTLSFNDAVPVFQPIVKPLPLVLTPVDYKPETRALCGKELPESSGIDKRDEKEKLRVE